MCAGGESSDVPLASLPAQTVVPTHHFALIIRAGRRVTGANLCVTGERAKGMPALPEPLPALSSHLAISASALRLPGCSAFR